MAVSVSVSPEVLDKGASKHIFGVCAGCLLMHARLETGMTVHRRRSTPSRDRSQFNVGYTEMCRRTAQAVAYEPTCGTPMAFRMHTPQGFDLRVTTRFSLSKVTLPRKIA